MLKIKNFINLLTVIGVKKSYVTFLIFLMLISSLLDILSLGLVVPYISTVFDINEMNTNFYFIDLKNYRSDQIIFYLTIVLILLFFFKTLLSIFTRWLISLFAYKQFAILQTKLMAAYQKMNYQEYIQRSSSEYIRNIRELCGECMTNIDSSLRVLSEFIIFIAIIIFLGLINFQILLFLVLATLPIFLIYEKVLKPININLGKIKITSLKQIYKSIDSGVKGLKEIRVLAKQNFFLNKISYYANKVYKTQKIAVLISDSPRYVFEFFIISSSLIVFFFLTKKSSDFTAYLPSLGVFLLATLRLLPTLASITSNLSRIGYGQFAVQKVYDDLAKYSHSSENYFKQDKILEKNFLSLEMKNVSFNYKNSKLEVFNNINFSLVKNDCIGIVGESGSGKTTFIDMLLGLLQPSKGEIYLNNTRQENFSSSVIDKIAYLPQEPIILDEKIKTNISLETNEKLIDQNKIEEALERSNLKKVIANLSDKENTIIGDGGVRLSGGQNKRLALARSFYHGKNIVIMDEATSSLDIKTENYIAEQIKELKGKLTIIIISHQNNILKYCDKIYKKEKKKIKKI